MRELSSSALFGARFRENAARALLLPRARPGKRTPLWQQRLKAQSLLEVAKRYGQFPIVLETYRECLRDVFDLPGLEDAAARAAHARAVAGRGRDAARLAVRLVAAVRLRRHLHVRGRHAQRRAARGGPLARPRPAARAARPGGAARADRPGRARGGRGRPPARERAHARRQRRRAARRAARRRRPDRRRGAGALPAGGVGARACSPSSRRSGARSGCGSAARSAGWPPRTPASTATRSAPCRRAGCRRRSSRRSRSRSRGWRAATRARTGRSPPPRRPARYGVDLGAGAARARARRRPGAAASCGPAAASASGATRRCCGACGVPRWRRCARRSSPPSSARSRASCRPGRAWTAAARRRRRPAARDARAAAGPGARPGGVGARRAAAPGRRLLARLDGPALRERRARLGRAPARSAGARAGWRSTSARTPAGSARRRSRATRPPEPLHEALRERLAAGAAFWTDLLVDLGEVEPRRAPGGALGPGLGRRGRPTTPSRRCARRG